jgi:hypothetical protein
MSLGQHVIQYTVSIVFVARFLNTRRLYWKYMTTSLYNHSPLHDMEFLQVCACFHGAIVQRVINFHAFTARVAEITNSPPTHTHTHTHTHKSASVFSYVQLIAMLLLNWILCLMSPLLITFSSVSFNAAQKCYTWFTRYSFVHVLYTVCYALFFS